MRRVRKANGGEESIVKKGWRSSWVGLGDKNTTHPTEQYVHLLSHIQYHLFSLVPRWMATGSQGCRLLTTVTWKLASTAGTWGYVCQGHIQ